MIQQTTVNISEIGGGFKPDADEMLQHVFGMPSKEDILNRPKYSITHIWIQTYSECGSAKTALNVKRFIDTLCAQYPNRKRDILNRTTIMLLPGKITDMALFVKNYNEQYQSPSWKPPANFKLGGITVQDPHLMAYTGSNDFDKCYPGINKVKVK